MGLFSRRPAKAETGVIDLRTAQRAVPEQVWGLPGRCPECQNPGYLDHIDLHREVMYQHCPRCFAKWETSRAEVEATAGT